MTSHYHETLCWGHFGPLVQSLSTTEIRIGKAIEQYSCLVPFLREWLCYWAPVTSTEWVGRPSFVITKEQLEVMRSYGLSWVEIAKALGEPKINFIVKKMFTRCHSYFFCHAPFFENGCLLFSFNSYFLKSFWTSIRLLYIGHRLIYVSYSPLSCY